MYSLGLELSVETTGCLERLGLETVSRRVLKCLGLVSVLSVDRLEA